VLAEAGDREERHVRALADSLRKAIAQGAPDERLNQLTRAAMGARASSDVTVAFRAWLDSQARYRAVDPAAPPAEGLRREMDRLWADYEAAVDEADGGIE
jgi:hypothetical protein